MPKPAASWQFSTSSRLPASKQRFFFLAKRFIAGETVDQAMDAVAALNAAGDHRDARLPRRRRHLAARSRTNARRLLRAARRAIAYARRRDERLGEADRDGPAGRRRLRAGEPARRARRGRDQPRPVRAHRHGGLGGHRRDPARLRAGLRRDARTSGRSCRPTSSARPGDVERAIALGARVRLCKGAYSEPPEIAYKDMPTIRREYLRSRRSPARARQLPRHRDPRRTAHRGGRDVRGEHGDRPRALRVPDALRRAARSCSAGWFARATGCASTFRTARTGRAISTAASPSAARTSSSPCARCSPVGR